MRREFDKFKLKYLRRAVVYGAVGGVCAGLAVVGGLMLALKLNAVVFGWYFYLLIAVGVAAVTGGVLFLALRPSDKALAVKLDALYALDEKAQTMIEYEGRQGAMLERQRADTELSLKNAPKRRPSVFGVCWKALAVIVALALFVAGLAVPQKRQPYVPETPYTVDQSKLESLAALIEDVKGDSVLKESVKTSFAGQLEELYGTLTADGITQAGMESGVQSTMYALSAVAIGENTYDDIAYGMSLAGETEISEALRKSASVYTEIQSNLSYYGVLGEVNGKLYDYLVGYLPVAAETLSAEVEILDVDGAEEYLSGCVAVYGGTLKQERVSSYYDTLETALAENGGSFGGRRGGASSGDALYDAVYDLYYTSNNLLTGYGDAYTLQGVISLMESALSNFSPVAVNAMEVQAYTYMADVYVRETLGSIFDVTVVGNAVQDGVSSDDGSEDDPGGPGGGGTGEQQYPSNDFIYNPDDGGYEFYITLLNGGYQERLEDFLDREDISDEVKAYIRAYLQYLTILSD